MELLLVNHPLDCPVCDKGGECPLQNQAMSNGRATSRFEDVKRTYPKPINISSQVLLDRERCVLCARCTRFSDQVAGDPFIALVERGALQQVGIYEEQPFESYFSGNTVQICPVGALTGAAYRFRSRPFDLVSTPSTCEHCASGCAIRTDHRRGTVLRRMAIADAAVNDEWNCDKGRWAFAYATTGDRFEFPLVRENGELRVASWREALRRGRGGLRAAPGTACSSVAGSACRGRLRLRASSPARCSARNDVDFRARPHSAEEAEFLAAHVVGTGARDRCRDLRRPRAPPRPCSSSASSPRTRARSSSCACARRSASTRRPCMPCPRSRTRGLAKVGGTAHPAAPGTETEVLEALAGGGGLRPSLRPPRPRSGSRHPRRGTARHGSRRPRARRRSRLGDRRPAAWVPRRPSSGVHRRPPGLDPASRGRARCARGRCAAPGRRP
jgi:NADH-quinone oxidoreductase subunit G